MDTKATQLGVGAALVVLGLLATTLSVMATLVSVLFVGCLLLFAGVLEAVSGLREAQWGGLLLHVVNGALSVIAGILVMLHPSLGALFLTLLMALFFVIGGLVRLVVSLAAGLPHRAWIALSGLLGLVLGLLVWSELPESAVWVIGAFVGIDLMVVGWSWLMLGLALRRRAHAISAALALLIGIAVAGPAGAQPAVSCGPFRVDWNQGELSPTAEKLEGFVYNDSSCIVTDVRIHVVAVNTDGHPIAETLGWVAGDIPARGRGYFVIALPSVPAAGYRVNVISFDQVSAGR